MNLVNHLMENYRRLSDNGNLTLQEATEFANLIQEKVGNPLRPCEVEEIVLFQGYYGIDLAIEKK